MCLQWLVIIGELHFEALSQENRVLKYNIDLLAPFPKRESRWVKETGGWIHEKNKVVLFYAERQYGRMISNMSFARHHGQNTGNTNNGSANRLRYYRIITSLLSYNLEKLDNSLEVH